MKEPEQNQNGSPAATDQPLTPIREISLKRSAAQSVEELQLSTAESVMPKRQKLSFNYSAPLDVNYPTYSRSMATVGLREEHSCESQNKHRFYLTPINEQFIIEPDHGKFNIRNVETLKIEREIGLKNISDRYNQDVTACRMIPGRAKAIAGDEKGNLYHVNLEEASFQQIDLCCTRGGVLDLAFSTPNRFIVVGENKQCSFNQLVGIEVRKLVDRFQDSHLIRKAVFLDENTFVAGESFHNLRIFDVDLLRVCRKISTEGSVYTICRLDSNRFCYGGSTNEICHYDCRSGRVVMTTFTTENWTGVIRHLSEFGLVYSDWRTIVLSDLRKGEIGSYQTKSRSGIWDAHAVNRNTLLTSSSDGRIIKMSILS